MKDKELKKLTDKQKAFCAEYIFDWNATRAYKAVYKDIKSDNAARANASRLLTNDNIQAYIAEIQKDIAKLAGISMLSQVNELKKIAYSNIADLFQDWTKLANFDELTEVQKAALLEISYKKDIIKIDGVPTDIETEFVKLKMHDKQKAIEILNKMLGFNAAENIDLTTKGEKLNTQMIVKFVDGSKEETE